MTSVITKTGPWGLMQRQIKKENNFTRKKMDRFGQLTLRPGSDCMLLKREKLTLLNGLRRKCSCKDIFDGATYGSIDGV
ncbi:unnamed protein product [Allacma fusca]|uniref:Uncharacterized protein n=1 Tax=Allacma fusca TaxID=39272 RepID=A0A8J2P1Q7_9HEXA|nr:unnamed protein product [Allacma fusca]